MRRSGTWWMTVVRLTLAALLFSALSPALAGVLFANRPDILARTLALPDQAAAYMPGEICHSEAAGTTTASPDGDADAGSDHAAHGIYCSLCLAANSLVTLPPITAPVLAFALAAPEPLPAVRIQRPQSSAPLTHHSRAPPAVPPVR